MAEKIADFDSLLKEQIEQDGTQVPTAADTRSRHRIKSRVCWHSKKKNKMNEDNKRSFNLAGFLSLQQENNKQDLEMDEENKDITKALVAHSASVAEQHKSKRKLSSRCAVC